MYVSVLFWNEKWKSSNQNGPCHTAFVVDIARRAKHIAEGSCSPMIDFVTASAAERVEALALLWLRGSIPLAAGAKYGELSFQPRINTTVSHQKSVDQNLIMPTMVRLSTRSGFSERRFLVNQCQINQAVKRHRDSSIIYYILCLYISYLTVQFNYYTVIEMLL